MSPLRECPASMPEATMPAEIATAANRSATLATWDEQRLFMGPNAGIKPTRRVRAGRRCNAANDTFERSDEAGSA